jgi:DNA-binding response OmpR family regulator
MCADLVFKEVSHSTEDVPAGTPRILLVEDEAGARELYQTVLGIAGYQIDLAKDGLEACERLKKNSYDLLITDNMMPKLCGIDLLRELRKTNSVLPAIMISGDMPVHEIDLKELTTPGGLLGKPFTASRFLAAVDAGLHGRALPPFRSFDDFAAVA